MGQRVFGLQKTLAQILQGVRIPEEARRHAPQNQDTPSQPSDCARLYPSALLWQMSSTERCRMIALAGLSPQLQPADFPQPNERPQRDLQQCVGEYVDAKTIASEILGVSDLHFWFLRVRGRFGPKPVKVNGSLIWTLSSIRRWIEWGCCGKVEFQAREQKAIQQT